MKVDTIEQWSRYPLLTLCYRRGGTGALAVQLAIVAAWIGIERGDQAEISRIGVRCRDQRTVQQLSRYRETCERLFVVRDVASASGATLRPAKDKAQLARVFRRACLQTFAGARARVRKLRSIA